MSREPNLGWIFYKKAFEVPDKNWFVKEYKDLNKKEEREKKDREKFAADIKNQLTEKSTTGYASCLLLLKNPEANKPIDNLATTYPGLLVGSGYSHEAGLHGEFKLGFYFDHTTGLPVIPGSSVKGVLRSVFPKASGNDKKEQAKFLNWMARETNSRMKEENIDDIPPLHDDLNAKDWVKLEQQIFDAKTSIYNRDIFYDAYITKPGKKGKILGNDFITPHKHPDRKKAHLDPFTNPTPLQFLKVLPGVTFRFQFKLHDFKNEGRTIFTKEQKRLLFRQILLTIGIGAKTNVGYGQFTPEDK